MGLQAIAEAEGISWVAFGHHATDAVASFLKSALMYIDRWDRGHEHYVRRNFISLVDELQQELSSSFDALPCGPLSHRISRLAGEFLASTDEAPTQPLLNHRPTVQIVRPLFYIYEHEIMMIHEAWGLQVESSGCGHSAAANTMTPRELVHYQFLRTVAGSTRGNKVLTFFHDLLASGIGGDGRVLHDARKNRDLLLGPAYRSGIGSGAKL
jgi:hypothetical protein